MWKRKRKHEGHWEVTREQRSVCFHHLLIAVFCFFGVGWVVMSCSLHFYVSVCLFSVDGLFYFLFHCWSPKERF